MKLILAVVEDDDAAGLMDALIENDFSATKLASTGGFLAPRQHDAAHRRRGRPGLPSHGDRQADLRPRERD